MKIRTITVGYSLIVEDIIAGIAKTSSRLEEKVQKIWENVKKLQSVLVEEGGYAVQTLRLSFNSFEEWLIPCIENYGIPLEQIIRYIDEILIRHGIEISNIGPCKNLQNAHYITKILTLSPRCSSSVLFSSGESKVSPNFEDCVIAANVCKEVHTTIGNLGNFRFCVGFDCPANTPFYPISYNDHSSDDRANVSIGLENGELISLATSTSKTFEEAKQSLYNSLKQAILPIQRITRAQCEKLGFNFVGVDASMNPGLSMEGSIGNGLEQLLINTATLHKDNTLLQNSTVDTVLFGKHGTLSAVSAVTSALKQLAADEEVTLAGYSGLMLPVMEDLILSERAKTQPPLYTMRDLLVFSTICGVGLDTVPVPGDVTAEQIARVYLEVGTLAFRLNKPLSCRLLPMTGLKTGDETDVDSPYLCNTRVFAMN
eukprot:gene3056-3249_t